jgi:DNA-binding HxlR family transcriptional regulator
MRRKSLTDMNCSVAEALDVVGDPWTLLIVRDGLWGFRRFSDFSERLGIPRTTLATRLDRLVHSGVFDKIQYQANPVRHEYVLTEKGNALRPVVISLMTWGDEWSGTGEAPVILTDRLSGKKLDPVLIDRISGRPLSEISVKAVGGPAD